ncbi:MAG: family 10 glycosylhydrolase, partial [Clostridia bacterium]|nr:family 10 glycosylhydrolase [Clostridia bacterium]
PDTTEEITTEEETTEEVIVESTPDGTIPFVPDHPEKIDTDWKAIWLSQFDMEPIYTDGGKQRAEADFRNRMKKVLDNVVKDGFNTVVLQLRPNADSIYPSDVYPPSKYAAGSYAGDFTYDPVAIIMELCKERNLSVHGWINPMRGMTEDEIKQVDDKYLIKQWYNDASKKGDYIVFVNKNWYLNIAHPEVRALICDGAAEILEKYDMDGVHMDDYFYPTTDPSFDQKAYNAYKNDGGKLSLADWRKDCLSTLVAELYATVKTHDLRALFGISLRAISTPSETATTQTLTPGAATPVIWITSCLRFTLALSMPTGHLTRPARSGRTSSRPTTSA